jgi:hypothetical protein
MLFQAFRSEVIAWRCLRHPNIVPFFGISDVFPVCLVSKWMPYGSMASFLVKNPAMSRMKHVSALISPINVANCT